MSPLIQHSLQTTKLVALAISSVVLAQATAIQAEETTPTPPEKEPSATAFPALDILPEGSILQKVRLPRYDKNYHPVSLLTADILTVVDTHKIDGKNVSIEVYNKNGEVQMRSDMRHAIYNQKDSTLRAMEAITLKGDKFQATGTGLIFHWHTNRGFLLGPATSQFITNTPNTSSAMQLRPIHLLSNRSLSIAGTLITLTTSLIAEPPSRLTQPQLKELDQLTQPSQSTIEQKQRETENSLSKEKKLIDSANATMHPFLKEVGQGKLIVNNEGTSDQTQKAPQKTSPSATIPAKPATAKSGKKETPPTPPQILHIDCDGGIYFDSDEGVLAYLKNIRLTEPRFKLTCSDELKVILDKKPVEPKTTPSKKADPNATPIEKDSTKKDPSKAEDKKSTTTSFGDLKRIIAIGKVRVISKDDKGNTFIATAETASYDAKTEEMILRGGLPRIQYGPNQYLQSKAPGQYIRMLKNGKLITTGKWAMQIDTSKKKTTP